MRYITIILLLFLFSGCQNFEQTSNENNTTVENNTTTENNSTDKNTTIDVTVLDGYIKNAIVKDDDNNTAIYIGTGVYRFYTNITYPITTSGGELLDTNLSFDINMTSYDSLIISPITTFIKDDTTLKNNLISIFGKTTDEFESDYIDNNDTDLAKLSILLYAILTDKNSTSTFTKTITNIDINSTIDDIFSEAIIASNSSSQKAIILKTKSLNSSASNFELDLNSTRQDIAAGLYDNNKVVFRGMSYDTVVSPTTSKIWLDRNIGASRVCTDAIDLNCYGIYFQWGSDGLSFSETDDIDDDWSSASVQSRQNFWTNNINGVCPIGFHVASKQEILDEDIENGFDSFLKLPNNGVILNDKREYKVDDKIALWSSSFEQNSFYFFDGSFSQDVGNAVGIPIRCVGE